MHEKLSLSLASAFRMFVCYLGLRWQAFRHSLAELLRRRVWWLFLPALAYFYLLAHGGDAAIFWLPALRGWPFPLLIASYALLFWLPFLSSVDRLRPPELSSLLASLPIPAVWHRLADILLALIACSALPGLLLFSAVTSWLRGGWVSSASLMRLSGLGLLSWMLASGLLWLWLQWQQSRRHRLYQPPWRARPLYLWLPLNHTLATLPAKWRALLLAAFPILALALTLLSWHYQMLLAMLVFTLLQLAGKLWHDSLERSRQQLQTQLAHWPLQPRRLRWHATALGLAPYFTLSLLFITLMLFQPAAHLTPLLWLGVSMLGFCLLLRSAHAKPLAESYPFYLLSWGLQLAFLSELSG
ncbi:hypothetical protein [Chromobacterium sp. IIBBL 290-4]|uniref:hypothetical protein n=1 Tax=Chromobacterium sp. IIBBL 290-4 TaxID=2953890 RepID=UPI0020B8F5CB|nr:hypothetical protein [Chromobacterium sp. IIBBL 290-4]UTH76275.1 hypothetical protein NKT35_09305 [Chromobacterium sp. IIBBL 290-4]